MVTSRPIELLPSRDGQALKSWLMKYNDVKIVTRDRASSYATAISESCPNVIQVADQRLEKFNKVKELQAKVVPILRISKDLGVNRKTVRSYFLQETLAPRSHPKSSNIELFTDHIVSRLNTDGYMIKDIIEEIKEFGYNGSRSQAYNNINTIKENQGDKT